MTQVAPAGSSALPRSAEALKVELSDGSQVDALLQHPPGARAGYVLAHGAGAGMEHPFVEAVADGLAARGVACLRFQFPSMQAGARRPDPPRVARGTVRAAIARARQMLPGLPLVAGGKSFGGRMSSQAQAEAPLPGVCGLAFLGFPLHPAGRPSDERAAHLAEIAVPMLFLQGSRDALAEVDLLRMVVERLGARATLRFFEAADHAFHVPARSAGSDAAVRTELLDLLAAWIEARAAAATSEHGKNQVHERER